MTLLNMEEREVAAEPIIWFIASLIALKCNSPSSPSVFVPSPPIIKSVIILTSFSRNTRILLPSNPTVYAIRINTQGLSYASQISDQVANDTTGVEISTLLFTSDDNVVAAVPILIFPISPIASFSLSDKASAISADELSPGLFNNALISSCDKAPSILTAPPLSLM